MTAEAPERPSRPRPIRRGPADLPFSFDAPALAEAAAAERGEPGWLRETRAAAAVRYEALPVEANQLYTPYVDLRAAELTAVRPYEASADIAGTTGPLEDADVLVELDEDRVVRLERSPEAAAAGVVVETFGQALARDPEGFRSALDAGPGLPEDKLAQLTAAAWSQGLWIDLPDGARLARPILLRTLAGAPDRAVFARTLETLGRGARAALVEELMSAPGL